jgi:hypothetical protein
MLLSWDGFFRIKFKTKIHTYIFFLLYTLLVNPTLKANRKSTMSLKKTLYNGRYIKLVLTAVTQSRYSFTYFNVRQTAK